MTETILTRISRITIAIAFSLVICIVVIGSTLAADHHGAEHRHAGHGHDRGRGHGYYAPAQPNYYYAPPPNYYTAPEPEYPPSEGINLFFKL